MFCGFYAAMRRRWEAWLEEQKRRRQPVITIDEQGVRRELPDGSVEQVLWEELESIDIVTTDAGPFAEDVFWVLSAGHHGCVVPGALGSRILDHSNRFPGWDTRALILAMGSTENARFEVWRRESSGPPT
jgi:hypothetical protein